MTEISAPFAKSGPSVSGPAASIILPAAQNATGAAASTGSYGASQTGFQHALATQISAFQPKLAPPSATSSKPTHVDGPIAGGSTAATAPTNAGNVQPATGNVQPVACNLLPATVSAAPVGDPAAKGSASSSDGDDSDSSTPPVATPADASGAAALLALAAAISPAIAVAGVAVSTLSPKLGSAARQTSTSSAIPAASGASRGNPPLSNAATPATAPSDANRAATLAGALALRNVTKADAPTSATPAVVMHLIAPGADKPAPAVQPAPLENTLASSVPAIPVAAHPQHAATDATSAPSLRRASVIGETPQSSFPAGAATAPIGNVNGTLIAAQSNPGDEATALVDRLVEARAAAQGSSANQSVQASVTHSEFGQVSLRFDSSATGLSVSMTSADPGFAASAKSILAGGASSGMAGVSVNTNAPSVNISAVSSQQVAATSSSAGAGFGQPGNESSQSGHHSSQQAANSFSSSSGFASNNGQSGFGQSGGQQGSSARPDTARAPIRGAGTPDTPDPLATASGIFA